MTKNIYSICCICSICCELLTDTLFIFLSIYLIIYHLSGSLQGFCITFTQSLGKCHSNLWMSGLLSLLSSPVKLPSQDSFKQPASLRYRNSCHKYTAKVSHKISSPVLTVNKEGVSIGSPKEKSFLAELHFAEVRVQEKQPLILQNNLSSYKFPSKKFPLGYKLLVFSNTGHIWGYDDSASITLSFSKFRGNL